MENEEKNMNKWKIVKATAFCCLVVLVFTVGGFYWIPAFQEMNFRTAPAVRVDSLALSDKNLAKELNRLKKDVAVLDRKLDEALPHLPYLVVNTTKNNFSLYDKKGGLLREGFCSSGSYTKLVLDDQKSWIFKTPKGRMTVLAKTENPVWTKPDWAFIEEGLPIPSYGDPSRYEKGVLGKFKLTMADGYLIHGTLYKRFLGMPVTHGCVRMGDEDLEAVYNVLSVGSYVYIY